MIAGRPSIDDATPVGLYDYGANARVHAGAAERCGFTAASDYITNARVLERAMLLVTQT